MKAEIQLSTKYIVLFVIVFISIVVFAVVFFAKNYQKYKNDEQVLITKEIKGKIICLKNENRGSYYIEIKTRNEILKMHSLPIAWEIKEYNIQVGDSIRKDANSKVITFFKLKKGVFEKLCNYEI